MAILQTAEGGFIGHLVGIYFEGITLLIFILLLLYLYKIYKVAKLKLTFLLVCGFSILVVSVFFSWIAKWYLWYYGTNPGTDYFIDLIIRFRMSLASVVCANYFFYMFFQKLFEKSTTDSIKDTKLIFIKIVEVLIIILGHIPAFLIGDENIALLGDVVAFVVTVLDTLYFIPNGMNSFKKAKSKTFRKQYLNIGLMSIFILNVLLMFLLDRVAMIIGFLGLIEGRYSLFYFLGWSSCVVALIFAIRAFIVK